MVRICPQSGRKWSLADSYDFIATFLSKNPTRQRCVHVSASLNPSYTYSSQPSRSSHTRHRRTISGQATRCTGPLSPCQLNGIQKRQFHDYFVTNLPSSSLHPDSRTAAGPHHKLPRSASTPHSPSPSPLPGHAPAAAPHMIGASRELTVVRIPLRSAKHHFGVSVSRGTRPYNEDTYQAGTIEIPAFAKRAPISLSRSGGKVTPGATSADSASGDPQVFYFGVFDGHGGNECSDFLREELHRYLERTAETFELRSSLKTGKKWNAERIGDPEASDVGKESLEGIEMKEENVDERAKLELDARGIPKTPEVLPVLEGEDPVPADVKKSVAMELQKTLIRQWKDTVGGYFRRFKPDYFSASASAKESSKGTPISIETVLMYGFLKADLDFVLAQARKPDTDNSDQPLNSDEILGAPALSSARHRIGGPKPFIGGSTASVALISTPTPTPFWHPASPSTAIVAHVGDTRILLCETATGIANPVTTNHHPSSPIEGTRLRRYAATFVTDSFGEERMSGLANTRAFGDMRSKRIGVSAEPEIHRVELAPAEYSFMVLVSDGVSGTLSDQEIVDVVKEAKTPEQGARDVVSFATEVSKEGDNATCLVVRLGGWERRGEGGMGSLGTKEVRDYRKSMAEEPRPSR
ncbi:phosphatase 2C-like domain-containing protein [Calycina marina]|uniref:Phosphatase 2C-like domain-containing protein n=1 Tax=Calycina marina TaxID=1763456 RepID=A0A9P8CEE7_9HELO|nr:phosphatase 2C-like domain-containing protein [Calycina marina]